MIALAIKFKSTKWCVPALCHSESSAWKLQVWQTCAGHRLTAWLVNCAFVGGHCVKIALDVAHQVIKELASNQLMQASSCAALAQSGLTTPFIISRFSSFIVLNLETDMRYLVAGHDGPSQKIVALESDESLKAALKKFDCCVSDIQAFIYETAGKDSFWFKRMIVLPETQKKLEAFHAELKEIERSLQLGVTVASYAFLQEAHQAQEGEVLHS
eukprot:243273-Pelagomonas_calceolata.AAC.4